MNLHEYQAKALLASYKIEVLPHIVVSSVEEALEKRSQLREGLLAVKAQVHAGGRKKAGGVRLVHSSEELVREVKNMLHKRLVTHQTDSRGQRVNQILIEEGCDIEKEYYLAFLLDRRLGRISFLVSSQGGVDIEEVAEKHSEKIYKTYLDQKSGLTLKKAKQLSQTLGFPQEVQDQVAETFVKLSRVFLEKDCLLLEVNPLVMTKDKKIVSLDCKMSIDDNALFRHLDLEKQRDLSQEDEIEALALQNALSFVKLKGNIGCLVNGAGLAMAVMDMIQLHGGSPANFLDVGGGAEEEKIVKALGLILKDRSVKGILVCIFGGIMKCDVVAKATVSFSQTQNLSVPLVVRFNGTHWREGKEILEKSHLNYQFAESLKEASEKIIELIQEK